MINLSHPTGILEGSIKLPSSKSISNRMLVLQKLYEPSIKLDNLSSANDSVLLKNILESDSQQIDVQDAGTAFRFLVAVTAIGKGDYVIQGTQRLHERPIRDLVDALKLFGADITYLEKEGFAPLRIVGNKLKATSNLIDVTKVKSSQFISAILLIAPLIEGEFNLKVDTKMSSYSYVILTMSCLRRMGFSVFVQGEYISVSKQQKFDGEYFLVEPDWSSFYYWFSMAHLSKKCDLFFPGLRLDNMQKERKFLFEVGNTRMAFEETAGGMRIVKKEQGDAEYPSMLQFSQRSDSVMTFGILLSAIGCKYSKIKGLESLKHKECDREMALTEQLQQIGVKLEKEDGYWELNSKNYELKSGTLFKSYNDHRMAMCVAPLAIKESIRIEDETVVKKSYPHFWEDLKSVGFQIL
ncbi:MAG: 3-phosphoshikimate 1-carboxyvinyltransferase [Bacteroidia bacterium]|jgi:3-phosphoshikimate 1-carboxyvinyltransferase|nr:3-phosphoshikimate 1-carboxyvinyltransferase [Bacteroidia bacterium]